MKTLILATAMAASLANAATPDVTRAEVAHLMNAVEKSQCKFNRNGSWHDATAARKHLAKKFDYMAKRDLVPSTEAFIERGASTSSTSGKPYQMQCGSGAAIASGQWLMAELKRYRGASR
ncbi:DUF5329 domain-containing protein [Massilia sp. PAMC28688]|uniref:DUF5329 domain-containing protein n=1 Tax=Massilia sp. PAMC28688 TaxID=2861283 RepID=UPI001C637C49|nr:DUF5329 domain-containing protein [Massilia sp. PAMC28688]QYF94451.1 DUF5329 domain-containing protein [Massilia sp. PAMC28688]